MNATKLGQVQGEALRQIRTLQDEPIRGDSSRQTEFFPMAKEVSHCSVSIPSQPRPVVFIFSNQFEVGILRRSSMVRGLEMSSQSFHRRSNIRVTEHRTLGNFLDNRARPIFVRAKRPHNKVRCPDVFFDIDRKLAHKIARCHSADEYQALPPWSDLR